VLKILNRTLTPQLNHDLAFAATTMVQNFVAAGPISIARKQLLSPEI